MSFNEEGIRIQPTPQEISDAIKKKQDNHNFMYVYLNSGAVIHFKCSGYEISNDENGIDKFIYDNPEPKVFFDLSSIEAIVER